MKEYWLGCSLSLFTKKSEEEFISLLSKTLSCNVKFIEQDEDGDKRWRADNIGLYFDIAFFHKSRIKSHKEFMFNIRPQNDFLPDPDVEEFDLDFHFKKLLENAGFEKVLTTKEYREYLASQK